MIGMANFGTGLAYAAWQWWRIFVIAVPVIGVGVVCIAMDSVGGGIVVVRGQKSSATAIIAVTVRLSMTRVADINGLVGWMLRSGDRMRA